MTPKVAPTVGLEHLHAPPSASASRRRSSGHRLRRERTCSFRALVSDADSTLVIVARFLALLELFREAAIAFDQAEALGELTVRWTGADEGEIEVSDEFDEDDTGDEQSDDAEGHSAADPGRSTPTKERRMSDRSDRPPGDADAGEAAAPAAPSAAAPEGNATASAEVTRLPASRASEGSEAAVAEEQIAFDINDFPGGARSAIEAVLMVVDEPISELSLASALELPVDDVVAHLHALEDEYAAAQRGFTLRSVAGGWRVYSRSEYAPGRREVPARRTTGQAHPGLAGDAGGHRLPAAHLAVEGQRGARSERRRSRAHPAHPWPHPGGGLEGENGAVLYGTTDYFLQRLGLGSLDDLPALAPYLPEVDMLDELAEQGRA